MLDVDGGVDVDAGGEQLLDVLPALGVAGAGGVGVRQLVDQQQRGMAGEGAVEVELLEDRAAIVERLPGQDLQALEQAGRLRAAVGLDDPDRDVEAFRALGARRLEHREGLPHAGGGAEEDLELPAPGPGRCRLDAGEQRVGIGSPGGHRSRASW